MNEKELEQMVEEFPSETFQRKLQKTANQKDVSDKTAVMMDLLNCYCWMRENTSITAVYDRDGKVMVGEVSKADDLRTAIESTKRLILHLEQAEVRRD
ncbi:hypothetical protein EXE51_05305 [Halorubrum sp. CGM5_25_10-8B]|uniref:hypothetical protein n=1 Tax=Halorubrum sp. CGM5_25_10-8B TaxID=2518115 RepID=UPI0010F43687|nr:hypothetical protein [Halorubrum sp. CGM5_25_10-8B]TKX38008.1 hypothetical protein EXE51_05305 [Halorubrum sp. CGM5_25_10-8B]